MREVGKLPLYCLSEVSVLTVFHLCKNNCLAFFQTIHNVNKSGWGTVRQMTQFYAPFKSINDQLFEIYSWLCGKV